MIAHGKDDVDVGRNLIVTGEYVEVSTWISSKKFIREDVHTRIVQLQIAIFSCAARVIMQSATCCMNGFSNMLLHKKYTGRQLVYVLLSKVLCIHTQRHCCYHLLFVNILRSF